MPAADRSLEEVVSTLRRLRAEEFTHDRIGEILGGGTMRNSMLLSADGTLPPCAVRNLSM